MISSIVSRLVILLFGTLYPAYASYKAVRTKNVKEYVKWMMYWIVFALFTCAETFTDIFLSFWFPFYYEIKIILVIYLLSPATKGSSILYRKFVHPTLTKREQEIDEYIAKAKEQGYHTVLNLGSKGVNYATTIIMQTAIKGGGGIVNQIRKSYSLGDLSTEKELRKKKKDTEDEVDEAYDEDPRLVRRRKGISPRRSTSSASQVDLYFPEVDVLQRPSRTAEENIIFSHIRSSEDISSGYSSTEPLYSGAKIEGREPLIRTASVGGTNRIRTRASLKTGLPNKKIMTEDESGWTPTEPDESQIETDDFPLSRSLPIPISGNLIAPFVRPEYQYLFGNLTQEQLFTLINNANFTQMINASQTGNLNVENKTTSRTSPSKILKEIIKEEEKNNQIDEAVVEAERKVLGAEENPGEMPGENSKNLERAPSDNFKNLEKGPNDNLEKTAGDNLENLKKVPNDNLKNLEKVPNNSFINLEKVPNDSLKNLEKVPNDNLKNLEKVPNDNLKNLENSEKVPNENLVEVPDDIVEKMPNDNLEFSEKNQERCGKYNKRPAPIPPNSSLLDLRRDSVTFEDAVDFEPEKIEIEQEFCTPDSSPVLSKKQVTSTTSSTPASSPTPEPETPEKDKPETPAPSKKSKKPKNESNISKMLHLPKIHLPFWHQKNPGNKSPVNISKNNSFSSLHAQEESGRFIPLRDETENKDVPVREMSSSPSSKRKSLTFD